MEIAERWDKFIELLKEITHDFSVLGIITEIIDVAICIALVILFLKSLKIKLKSKKFIFYVLGYFAIYGIAYFLDLTLIKGLTSYVGFWILGLILILYSQEIKHMFDNNLHNSIMHSFTSEEEKKHVIDVLVSSSLYLSKRKTGALITIEGKDSLNSIIDKAISIDATLSVEMLSTIFYVGTVTHDGAVIVRKNTIKCAGAYLPSTDRYDIPKELGTRHRSAIGVSERYDALTIVVSEETGNISLTLNGNIDINVTEAKLREMLEQYLTVDNK